MNREFLRPRWVLAHAVVAALLIVFVILGLWQLDRLDQRRIDNALGESRYAETPYTIAQAANAPLDSLEYRRVAATGRFDPENEILIRSQVHRGNAGFHVVTPLVGERGEAVLVNRGWVPLGLAEVPVDDALPPEGEQTVVGWVHLTQERPPLGPEDPAEGRLVHMNRVDVERMQAQLPYDVTPFYLVEIGDRDDLPIPVAEPSFDEEGPHLAYAIQWFGFAVVLGVGWFFFVRRQTARAKSSTTS